MAALLKVFKKSIKLKFVDPKDKVFGYEELNTIIRSNGFSECRFVCNEEICFVVGHRAKEKGLPLNQLASAFYQLLSDTSDDEDLYGDVLICKTSEML